MIEEQNLWCIVVTLYVQFSKKAYKWIPIQTAYAYTINCMPNLLRPVQFGQALTEITDYSIGMMVFQNHTILQLLRDVSRQNDDIREVEYCGKFSCLKSRLHSTQSLFVS